ncbi:flagellar type III secretion system pore protein FliP [Oryzihumus leptocrescens]|uniref:Flagellar biosynthetic protein FliP n=1 Tax=Oryzihumus leptocrescens TaxID=297536 RepID=A0A542Z9K0_9MICO|nr:flagellar type III secretion system pore protein FliP [Oryzihumus leptocrescens]TQL56992.1 flagellar biosynthetic protein FliP [Oryzihumus leptocrescens]
MAEPQSPARTARQDPTRTRGARPLVVLLFLLAALFVPVSAAAAAHAAPRAVAAHPAVTALGALPAAPNPTPSPGKGTGNVSVKVDPVGGKPSQTVSIILLLTVLSVAPALLVLTTSFTKVIVVLSLTRNALGTPTIPPNQVLAGLALFLSLFIMAPVLGQMNAKGVQPYLAGKITQQQAYERASAPLHDFMIRQTRKDELATMVKLSKEKPPARPADVPMTTLIPAFVLSELKSAFIIGFVIFIPFLVIDLVVSSSLMSMGMMMLPPVLISLPFKLLLFVMVDGWDMVAKSLVTSYH